jgi:hypothetical protein
MQKHRKVGIAFVVGYSSQVPVYIYAEVGLSMQISIVLLDLLWLHLYIHDYKVD